MKSSNVLGQTRRAFVRKLIAAVPLVMSGSIIARSEALEEARNCSEGFVIVNGWVLTDQDTRYQLGFLMHDF
jgi:hypothetical protein